MRVTRTIQPLHFEDFDPRRFEDLVRQLLYDFRQWASLEAVGRTGSDEGIDILGVERFVDGVRSEAEEDEATQVSVDRRWIVQCKREKSIASRQIAKYVSQSLKGKDGVHGFILATCADLSRKARDAFRTAVLEFGVEEAYVWGRAELEDLLFAPRNDHLLFAYFGVSLQVRRRSVRTELAAEIALKRKLTKVIPLRPSGYDIVFLRDPNAPDYPRIPNFAAFRKQPRWKYYEASGHFPTGHLQLILRETVAWVDPNELTWDIPDWRPLTPVNDRLFQLPDDLWKEERDEAEIISASIPEDRRATVKVYAYVPYARILAVDDLGDAYNEGAHILVEHDPEYGFFEPDMYTATLARQYLPDLRLDDEKRIHFFEWPGRK